jgi:ribosomal-protein-alanine N-acetyltransferase
MIIQKNIETEQLQLRNITLNDDLKNYMDWLTDESINKFLEIRLNLPKSVAELQDFVTSVNNSNDSIIFGIFHKKSDTHIGNIKLGPINWHHKVSEMGLLIGDKSYWGKGYATEAIGLVSNYAFETLNLFKVTAGCYEGNVGSLKAFLKDDFREEGRLHKQWLSEDRREDGVLLGKINPIFDLD